MKSPTTQALNDQFAARRRQGLKRTPVSIQTHDGSLVALCNDGTMWTTNMNRTGKATWLKIKDIPQPDFEGEV